MNWSDAIELMRAGHAVRRKSESYARVIDPGRPDLQGIEHAPIIESGQEGCRLMHAWTVDEKPALVFMGSGSKCLFVPDDVDRAAIDWEIES